MSLLVDKNKLRLKNITQRPAFGWFSVFLPQSLYAITGGQTHFTREWTLCAQKTPGAAETCDLSLAKHKPPPPPTTTTKSVWAYGRAHTYENSHGYFCRRSLPILIKLKNLIKTVWGPRDSRPAERSNLSRLSKSQVLNGRIQTGKMWTARVPPTLSALLIC